MKSERIKKIIAAAIRPWNNNRHNFRNILEKYICYFIRYWLDVAVVIEIHTIVFDTKSFNIIFIPLTSESAVYQSYVYQTIVKGRQSIKEDRGQ